MLKFSVLRLNFSKAGFEKLLSEKSLNFRVNSLTLLPANLALRVKLGKVTH